MKLQFSEPVEIEGQRYVIGKMNAMTQFHVARKLAPVLSAMGVSASQIGDKQTDLGAMLGPIMDVVATMDDATVEFIINNCLAVVRRIDGERAQVVRSSSGQMMYADIEMTTMVRLAVEVIKDNLGGFFGQPPGAPISAPS